MTAPPADDDAKPLAPRGRGADESRERSKKADAATPARSFGFTRLPCLPLLVSLRSKHNWPPHARSQHSVQRQRSLAGSQPSGLAVAAAGSPSGESTRGESQVGGSVEGKGQGGTRTKTDANAGRENGTQADTENETGFLTEAEDEQGLKLKQDLIQNFR